MAHVAQKDALGLVGDICRLQRDGKPLGARLHELLKLVSLRFDLHAQLLTLDQVADAVPGHRHIDRLGDEVSRTQRQTAILGTRVAGGSDKDHRNIAQQWVRLQTPAGLISIHLRHHDVEQNQSRSDLRRQLESGRT